MNFTKGVTLANTVITKLVRAHRARSACISNVTTDVVIDVSGSLTPAAFAALPSPQRIVDSRNPAGDTDDEQQERFGPLAGGTTRTIPVAGRVGLAGDVENVVLSVAAVAPGANGFFTLYPCGTTRPLASSMNFTKGVTLANTVITKLSAAQARSASTPAPPPTSSSTSPVRFADPAAGEPRPPLGSGRCDGCGPTPARWTTSPRWWPPMPVRRRRDRPWVLVNMVASLDGAITIADRSGGLGGPADKAMFSALRGVADVVMAGAGTVRAEGYGPARPSDAVRAVRRARGQAEVPRIAVVTRSLDLDLATPLFTEAVEPTDRDHLRVGRSRSPGRRGRGGAAPGGG